MKNRVLLTLLIVFIIVSGVCITCGTIFVIRDVEVVDETVLSAGVLSLSDAEKDEIIENCGLRGKNILFNLNEDKITRNIKHVNSMFKLKSVTAKFPSRVILVVARRVPIYYDGNGKWYDAEMCCVTGTPEQESGVSIAGAKLNLIDDLEFGDFAVGKDARTKAKIEQLKLIATYFRSIDGFEIDYDDDAGSVGADLLCLNLHIKSDVLFQIKIKPTDDFLYALEFTDQVYRQENAEAPGVYLTLNDNHNPGKFLVKYDKEEYPYGEEK